MIRGGSPAGVAHLVLSQHISGFQGVRAGTAKTTVTACAGQWSTMGGRRRTTGATAQQLAGAFLGGHRSPDTVVFRGSKRVVATFHDDGTFSTDPLRGLFAPTTVRSALLFWEEDLERVAQATALELPVPRILGWRWQTQAMRPRERGQITALSRHRTIPDLLSR